jgi:hypothetical protein
MTPFHTTLTMGVLSLLGMTALVGRPQWADAPRPAAEAPAPWLRQDPGDSLYRAARNALNRGEYQAAARQFATLRERYPRSGYAPDSFYWQAFALEKLGATDNLRQALELLTAQVERYPDARTVRDARALRLRVQGELARLGDADAAAAIATAAAPAAAAAEARGVAADARGAAADARAAAAEARAVGRAGQGRGKGGDECNDEDDDRLIALNALLQMQAEQAIPILRQVLARRDAGSVCLRRQAVFLVSQKKSPETAKILLDAVRGDPDPEVRENAVFWLSQAPTADAVPALDSILRVATDPELQEKAVFALAQIKDEAAGRALRAHLERAATDDRVKETIIFWLGQRKAPETAQYLKDFFTKTSSTSLKEKVLFALSQNPMEENGRWLLDVALDANTPVELRKTALFWAAQSKTVPFADLARVYDQSQDVEIKEQLIFGFSQSKAPAAVDKLMSIARSETNRDLRGKAVFWLGQSHDPRVAQFLLEVINK